MNKKQKIILFSGIAIIVISLIIWIFSGGEMFTKTQILIEKKDELFPDMTYKEWVDKFIWGLDLTGIISGITAIVSALLMFLFRTKNKNL